MQWIGTRPQVKCCKATSFREALTHSGRLSWRVKAVHSCRHSSQARHLMTAYSYDFTCSFLLWLLSEIPLHLRLYLLSPARVIPGGLLCFSHGAAVPTLCPWRMKTKWHCIHGASLVFISIGEKKDLETANLSCWHVLYKFLVLFCVCGH